MTDTHNGQTAAADIDQRALAVADEIVRQMMDKGALLAVRNNDDALVPMALDRQFQLKAGWQIAIASALCTPAPQHISVGIEEAVSAAIEPIIRQYPMGNWRDHQVKEAVRNAVVAARAEIERLESLHRSEIADMAERFRAVNVSEAVMQLADILPPAPTEHVVGREPVAEIVPAATPAAEILFGRDIKFLVDQRDIPIGTKLYAAPAELSVGSEPIAWTTKGNLETLASSPKEARYIWGLPSGSTISVPLYAAPQAPAELVVGGATPSGWFVKDFADGWIFCDNEADATRQAEATGAMLLVGFSKTALVRADWEAHDLVPGRAYESIHFGLVTYVGVDTFHGETTHEFSAAGHPKYRKPEALGDFLKPRSSAIKGGKR